MKTSVLMIAGGTGGHIFPALAVAEALEKRGNTIYWLGARYGLETKLVPEKYRLQQVSIRAVRRSGIIGKLLLPWRLCRAIFRSYLIIRRIRPDVVLAMGGYVAAPGGIAAWLARKKLVIHEQNAKLGLTNRYLAKLASVRFQAFADTFTQAAKTVGNPVRQSLLAIAPPQQRYQLTKQPLKVLILGGSQGATPINECMQAVWREWMLIEKFTVWHQSGRQDQEALKVSYRDLPIATRVDAFIEDMAAAYAWADVVICRAGAMTVSEIAAVGVASILIPYPYAADDHQQANARYLADKKAAILMLQQDMHVSEIRGVFHEFLADRRVLLNMAQAAKANACLNATATIVAEI